MVQQFLTCDGHGGERKQPQKQVVVTIVVVCGRANSRSTSDGTDSDGSNPEQLQQLQ